VPPEVIFYAARPENPRNPNNTSAIVHRPESAYFVQMGFNRGRCTLTTFDEVGAQIGARDEAPDYEYELYNIACNLYPQSPSAGYELLKLGRILSPVQLQPADAAHWRQVAYAGGVGWVNLNSTTVSVYSDSDFPHWLGWKIVDDDTNGDGRCQSPFVMSLLGLPGVPDSVEQRNEANAVVARPES
jgi:hydroxyethylthiazole kinase